MDHDSAMETIARVHADEELPGPSYFNALRSRSERNPTGPFLHPYDQVIGAIYQLMALKNLTVSTLRRGTIGQILAETERVLAVVTDGTHYVENSQTVLVPSLLLLGYADRPFIEPAFGNPTKRWVKRLQYALCKVLQCKPEVLVELGMLAPVASALIHCELERCHNHAPTWSLDEWCPPDEAERHLAPYLLPLPVSG